MTQLATPYFPVWIFYRINNIVYSLLFYNLYAEPRVNCCFGTLSFLSLPTVMKQLDSPLKTNKALHSATLKFFYSTFLKKFRTFNNLPIHNVYVRLVVVVISQCICVSKYTKLFLKYIQFLFVNQTSIKLGKNIPLLPWLLS